MYFVLQLMPATDSAPSISSLLFFQPIRLMSLGVGVARSREWRHGADTAASGAVRAHSLCGSSGYEARKPYFLKGVSTAFCCSRVNCSFFFFKTHEPWKFDIVKILHAVCESSVQNFVWCIQNPPITFSLVLIYYRNFILYGTAVSVFGVNS